MLGDRQGPTPYYVLEAKERKNMYVVDLILEEAY